MKLFIFKKRVQAAFVLLLISTMTFGKAESVTPPNSNNDTIIQKIVGRLLGDQTQFRFGQLPENLPVKVPLPDKAQVLGSSMYSSGNGQILLDAPQSRSEVFDFYSRRLSSSGWENISNSYAESTKGFVESNFVKPMAFCFRSSQDTELTINANPVEKGLTDVRINLNSGRSGTKCQQYPGSDIPLPTLIAPPNTRLIDATGGGGENSFDSRVKLETKLDSKSLAAHYDPQFQSAAWKRLDAGHSGTTAWSRWELKDKKGNSWHGFLYLSKLENEPNQYSALAYVSLL